MNIRSIVDAGMGMNKEATDKGVVRWVVKK